jgi:selenocysteine-specific elongation factor
MLAGAAGIDLVILVIGADESIKPQTREHFDICRLLGIRHGLIALTKADLVDPELLELVKLEAAEFATGSFLENAPILAVSGATGQGLAELRDALTRLSEQVPPRDTQGPFRLPIDRSFSLHGFGTVVTGTLASGRIRVEDEVEVHPQGRRLRVRNLQVHGGPVDTATAGQRTAVNLAAVEAADLQRGMVLTPPGLFRATQTIDCAFDLLPSALPLKHRQPIHFHSSTSELEAEVRLLRGTEPLAPGQSGFVRLLLSEPILLLPGDRFIARMFSPVTTIGGGTVLDNHPSPHLRKPAVLARLPELAHASLAARLRLFASESETGDTVANLAARCGAHPQAILAQATAAGLIPVKDPEPRLVPLAALATTLARLQAALADFHRQNPLLPGMPKASAPVPAFLLDLLLTRTKDVVADGDILRLATHRLQLKADEDEAAAKMESLFRQAGLAVPAVPEVLAKSGIDPSRARSLLQLLLRDGRLVKITADLICHREALVSLRQILASRKGQAFQVAEFKDWTGVSRKYAIPLLEFLDRERLTRRDGDRRLIL